MGVTLKPAYTKFYKDAYIEWNLRNETYAFTTDTFWLDDRFVNLREMISNKFRLWEVFVDDKTVFLPEMVAIFKRYEDYYKEKITAYETQIDFLDGTKTESTYGSTSTNTPRTKYQSENYDLPRSETSINRPTSKTINGGIEGSDTINTGSSTTSKGGDVIDLKRRYLDLIRSLYDEFADKFKPLFIELFDYTMVKED